MKAPAYTRRFEKDLKRMQRRGKDLEKLKTVVRLLLKEKPLEARYREHALIGDYVGRRECHIEPDWLLIYKMETTRIVFERTGSHADLFG